MLAQVNLDVEGQNLVRVVKQELSLHFALDVSGSSVFLSVTLVLQLLLAFVCRNLL